MNAPHAMNPAARAVVVGIGAFAPLGRDSVSIATAVAAGRDGLSPVTRFDTSRFTGRIAATLPEDPGVSVSPDDAAWYDRATLLALGALDEALAPLGDQLAAIPPDRIGVVLGSSHSGLVRTEEVACAVLHGAVDALNPRVICATFVSHCTAVIAQRVGARGRVLTVSSACASSNAAIGIAADLVAAGEVDLVVAGGSDTVSLSVMAGFHTLHALSESPSAPFGTPVGLSIGEGAGLVVLVSFATARRLGLAMDAEILGYGLSGDAHHATAPDAEGRGAERAMRHALTDAGLPPDAIDFINAHGTGTDANDAAESIACARVFGPEVRIASLKGALGHTLGASGALELIVALRLAERGLVPHTAHLDDVRPGCAPLAYVRGAPVQARADTQICNNYGFGGHNASVISQAPVRAERFAVSRGEARPVIVGLGATCAAGQGLRALAAAMAAGRSLAVSESETGLGLAAAPSPQLLNGPLKAFARTSAMTRFALLAAQEALGDDAPEWRSDPRAGVITGAVFGAERSTEKFMESVFAGDPGLASAFHFPMITMNATAGQIGIAFGIEGYTSTLAGGAAAAIYGLDLVARDRQQRLLVVGSDEASPILLALYAHAGILARGELRHGQAQAFGEGAAAIALARRDTGSALCPVAGWGQANDPRDLGVDPRGTALIHATRRALDRANWSTHNVDLILVAGEGEVTAASGERRAGLALFGASGPPARALAPILGYAPSALPLLALVVGALAARDGLVPGGADPWGRETLTSGPPRRVLVMGYDLVGTAYAVALGAGAA